MRTSTPTEVTRIATEATPQGVRLRTTGGAFRVMLLQRTATCARVALVADRALLLAGDRIRIELTVADGTALEVVETTGTVAYDMRGHAAAWEVAVQIGPEAHCRWEGLPFVVAAGAQVRREQVVDLAPGASFAQRETLVLGRHGEHPGCLENLTRISRAGRPVLVEQVDGAHLGPYRIMDSIVQYGGEPAEVPDVTPPAAIRLELADDGTCWRSLSHDAHRSAQVLDPIWTALVASPRLSRSA